MTYNNLKRFSSIVFIVIFLLTSQPRLARAVSSCSFVDDFNSYNVAGLAGQGSWILSLTDWSVISTPTQEGTRAVGQQSNASNYRDYKDGTKQNEGGCTFYMRQSTTGNSEFEIDFYEGTGLTTIIFVISFYRGTAGQIALTGVSTVDLAAITANTWHQIDAQWRASPSKQVRARVDNGAWSSWINPVNSWTTGVGTIAAFGGNGGTSGIDRYLDTIGNGPDLPVAAVLKSFGILTFFDW